MSDGIETNKIFEVRDKINSVSPSFCLAKWMQVTIHLQNGNTHSCHHPKVHNIPLREIKADPSALHNTNQKKLARKEMLEGVRPSECDYCWNIEDSAPNLISDRYLKSSDEWAAPHFDKVLENGWEKNINPSYVEVNFSNTCNLKCAYCAPEISSKWMEEIKKFGPYPTSGRFNNLEGVTVLGRTPIPEDEANPYVEAFWKWWPDLVKDLKVFRITGGEPLLTKNTFQVLEFLKTNPMPDLELGINSNLSVPFPILERFVDCAEVLIKEKKIKNLFLFTSIDTFGVQAEYLRFGLKYDPFIKNVEYVLDRLPDISIVFMCTFNALSVVGFKELLHETVRIKEKFDNPLRKNSAVILDISYLRYPAFLSIKALTTDFIPRLAELGQEMILLSEKFRGVRKGFDQREIAKMVRMVDWMKHPSDPVEIKIMRKDFVLYFKEYDRRRKVKFLEVFPEMSNFWRECESLFDSPLQSLDSPLSPP